MHAHSPTALANAGLVALSLALATGCASAPIAIVSAASLPNPVMFGPIERVGDKAARKHDYTIAFLTADFRVGLYRKTEVSDSWSTASSYSSVTATTTTSSAGIRLSRAIVEELAPRLDPIAPGANRYKPTDVVLFSTLELQTTTDTNRSYGHTDETVRFDFHVPLARFVPLQADAKGSATDEQ